MQALWGAQRGAAGSGAGAETVRKSVRASREPSRYLLPWGCCSQEAEGWLPWRAVLEVYTTRYALQPAPRNGRANMLAGPGCSPTCLPGQQGTLLGKSRCHTAALQPPVFCPAQGLPVKPKSSIKLAMPLRDSVLLAPANAHTRAEQPQYTSVQHTSVQYTSVQQLAVAPDQVAGQAFALQVQVGASTHSKQAGAPWSTQLSQGRSDPVRQVYVKDSENPTRSGTHALQPSQYATPAPMLDRLDCTRSPKRVYLINFHVLRQQLKESITPGQH